MAEEGIPKRWSESMRSDWYLRFSRRSRISSRNVLDIIPRWIMTVFGFLGCTDKINLLWWVCGVLGLSSVCFVSGDLVSFAGSATS